jgi:hypothetical protein
MHVLLYVAMHYWLNMHCLCAEKDKYIKALAQKYFKIHLLTSFIFYIKAFFAATLVH